MKIALFTTNRTKVPPEQNIIAASASLTKILADGLVEKGHEVTLYAAKGSESKAKIVDLGLEAHHLDYDLHHEHWVRDINLGMKQIYIGELFKNAKNFDIIHLQTDPIYLGMPFAHMVDTPTVVTTHLPLIKEEKKLLDYYKSIPIVSISDNQRKDIPTLNFIQTIYDGLDIENYKFYPENSKDIYLSFLGRLVKEKGVAESIATAKKTDKKLIVSGVGTDEFIKSLKLDITEKMSIIDPIPNIEGRIKFMGESIATLMPIQWEEPFGLVMVESMASGTPVIAFARGSVPEVVKDGETGFIINSSDDDIRGDFIIKKTGIEGLCEAVEKIYSMSDIDYKKMRRSCREHVEKNFTARKMVDEYEKLYEKIISRSK